MDSIATRASAAERRVIVAHYERVTPLIVANFAGIPLVFEKHPQGIGGPAVWSNRREWHGVPHEATQTLVHTNKTTQPYPLCDEHTILVYVKRHDASGVHSWTPVPGRPDALRYARIQLKPDAGGTQHQLRDALLLVRDILRARGVESIPLWEGRDAALFIPFADAPDYPRVRAWLHTIENAAIEAHPELVIGKRHKDEHREIPRIEITVEHNAPGLHTRLPYSLTAAANLPMVTPFAWSEFDTLHNGHITAENAATRLARGDVFAQLTAELAHQTFAAVSASAGRARMRVSRRAASFRAQWTALPEPLGHPGRPGINLRAALAVLGDGKPRTAREIRDAAVAQQLLPRTATENVIYVSLTQYLDRATHSGRRQLIVQDVDRRFHVNHPVDEWPEPADSLPARTAIADIASHEGRLRELAHSNDPAAFEQAVCAAFGALGFVTRHIGGEAAPDGLLEAPLGRLAYRVTLECKTTVARHVPRPDVAEAAKWRDQYAGDYAIIVGPSFSEANAEFASELALHRVSAWSVDDILAALRIAADPDELRPVFEPGYAEDHLPALVWERAHGHAKRVAVTAELLREVLWRRQVALVGHREDAPLITEDAAMLLVDEELANRGSPAVTTRADIQAAFAYLTSPLVDLARYLDTTPSAIVILSP